MNVLSGMMGVIHARFSILIIQNGGAQKDTAQFQIMEPLIAEFQETQDLNLRKWFLILQIIFKFRYI